MKKLSLFLILTLSLSMPQVGGALGSEANDVLYTGPKPLPVNARFATWNEVSFLQQKYSLNPWDSRLSDASRSIVQASFPTVLSVCKNHAEEGCILSVEYRVADNDAWKAARALPSPGQAYHAFGTQFTGSTEYEHVFSSTYEAEPRRGLFRAGLPALWELPGANHQFGNQYFINAAVTSQVLGAPLELRSLT